MTSRLDKKDLHGSLEIQTFLKKLCADSRPVPIAKHTQKKERETKKVSAAAAESRPESAGSVTVCIRSSIQGGGSTVGGGQLRTTKVRSS